MFVFVTFYVFFKVVDAVMGNRVSAEVEIEGLDMPEMGVLAYPDFVLGPGTPLGAHMASVSVPAKAATALKPARSDVNPGLGAHMKLVKCIVRPDFVAEVTAALETLGVSGITVTDVRGRGRRTRPVGDFRGLQYQTASRRWR